MRRCRPWLGTLVEIAGDSDAAIEAGFGAIERIHRLMSAHEPMSELARINRSGPGAPVHLSADTIAVLDRALFWAESSAGAFDPVAAGARAALCGAVPVHPGQSAPAQGSNWRDLRRIGSFAWLGRPACIDLGGIAKGHAVDCAIDAMRAAGATWGLVNAGGDLAAFGKPQAVEVVEPLSRRPVLRLALADRALATSAGLATSGELEFAHLGGEGPFVSVTVEAARAIDADALTKIAFAGHPDLARLLSLADARAVAQPRTGAIVELGLGRAA